MNDVLSAGDVATTEISRDLSHSGLLALHKVEVKANNSTQSCFAFQFPDSR